MWHPQPTLHNSPEKIHPTFRIHVTNVSYQHYAQEKNSLSPSSSSVNIFFLVNTERKIYVTALKALNLSQRLAFIPVSFLTHIPFYNLTTVLCQRIQCSSPSCQRSLAKFTLRFERFVFVTLCSFSASERRMNKSTKQTNSNLPTFTVGSRTGFELQNW